MICWECSQREGTKQFDVKKKDEFNSFETVSQRWYCEECYERIDKQRKEDLKEYIRLKMKLMYERAVKMLEVQDVDLYEYKEALEAVRELSEEKPEKFDSSHEMVAAAIIINQEIPVKVHHTVERHEVDFYIPSLKAVLEIDGELFHKTKKKEDRRKDEAVRNALGLDHEVIRIDTKYIEQNAKMLVEAVETIRAEKQKVRKANYGLLPDWYDKPYSERMKNARRPF